MANLDRREFLGAVAGLCLPSLPIATTGTVVFFSWEDLASASPPAAKNRLALFWHSDRVASLVPASVFPRLCAHGQRMGRVLEPEEVARFVSASE